MTTQKRIAVGMSGGVDSASTATMLLSQGWDVVGVTCLFHDDESSKQAISDAATVCEYLGIPHYQQDARSAFRKRVIDPFVAGYAQGNTPSPCVVCNVSCKIPELLIAADELGCSHIATGHYARIEKRADTGRFVIRCALDDRKDQSYMLSLLSQEQLSRIIFPLGGLTKAEVRAFAEERGLPVAHKAESQDICFISGAYTDFLEKQGVSLPPGEIVDMAGRVVGTHQGIHRYTIGQRKGLGISGSGEPLFVVRKEVATNRLIVGTHEDVFIDSLEVVQVNWQAFEELTEPHDCMVKLRYRSEPSACRVVPLEMGRVRVELISTQPTTAPGQYAVFYEMSTLLGGGVISSVQSKKDTTKP